MAEVVTDAELSQLFEAFSHIFHEDGDGLDGSVHVASMTIEAEGPHIYQRPYRTPLTKKQVIDDAVDQMPSNSPKSPIGCA